MADRYFCHSMCSIQITTENVHPPTMNACSPQLHTPTRQASQPSPPSTTPHLTLPSPTAQLTHFNPPEPPLPIPCRFHAAPTTPVSHLADISVHNTEGIQYRKNADGRFHVATSDSTAIPRPMFRTIRTRPAPMAVFCSCVPPY